MPHILVMGYKGSMAPLVTVLVGQSSLAQGVAVMDTGVVVAEAIVMESRLKQLKTRREYE